MNVVEPIRNLQDIEKFKLLLEMDNQRNLLLFILGINSGLRISDLLSLKIKDVINVEFIEIKEKKLERKNVFQYQIFYTNY